MIEKFNGIRQMISNTPLMEISFTYKAREGQINPEMIAVTVK